MRLGPLAAALAAVAFSFSGCVGDSGPETGDIAPTADPTDDINPGLQEILLDRQRPSQVGDWWDYRFETEDPALEGFDLRVVMAGRTGGLYDLTAVEAGAVNLTFFTHIPALGPVQERDLAVTRHGHFVPFFQFPLRDGATWEVQVRGPWTATAHLANLTVGGLAIPGWRVEYTANGALQHVLEWSAATGWITLEETYFGQATPRHRLSLQDWGSDWKGTIQTYTVTDVYNKRHGFNQSAGEMEAAGQESFTVPDGGDWLLLGAFVGGQEGTCAYDYAPPNTPGGLAVLGCGETTLAWETAPAQAGEWTFRWALGTEAGFCLGEAFLVDAETRVLP